MQSIPRISPASGVPVVCMGTVPALIVLVVAALTVLVVFLVAAFTCSVSMLLSSEERRVGKECRSR